MVRGLSEQGSSMKMIPSFVQSRPTGAESGTFLALDLGGSNFRVLKLTLDGKKCTENEVKKYVISNEAMTGTSDQLFDFIAGCVAEFLGPDGTKTRYALGFTFSFPVNQTSLKSGTLLHWTKGFTTAGVVGQDVVQLLQRSLQKKGLVVDVVALANDTVGTLITACLDNLDCELGLILGTGTNGAYFEKVANIPKWKGETSKADMVINMEWGGFDGGMKTHGPTNSTLRISKYDHDIDANSPNPKEQVFEKLISGFYLGEIARLICLDLVKSGVLLSGRSPSDCRLALKDSVPTHLLSAFEGGDDEELDQMLAHIFGKNLSESDKETVQEVCDLVSDRAARLSAAGVYAVVDKIGKSKTGCTVAVDGSLFIKHPTFESKMVYALVELQESAFGNEDYGEIKLVPSEDGSGVGAAIIAAIAHSS
eukprot:TRINITY_DN11333_c0_g1::TRINITY_DN11333_c0_g1_i1::g.26476::m.26476 TRINITY_DN11333_c0_g1::TRINITY_DN11333_c0_g1_i1::g.26476  ORF type:complete len:476 (+),score=54.11,sp/P83776/HXKB_CANAL/37.63/9e-100,Hexokinase_1/PF00349.16/3.2e-67,Hexokinase_2/PF03727.11/2.3e-65 TRINITY_DN11333_c0_g1_i1:160-1428(+)